MVQRLTYRRRHAYNTASNKVKVVKTTGGKLTFHYRTKVAKGPSCADCGGEISGIPHLRPKVYATLSKRQKTVSRAYGGVQCAHCVRDRIVRAFLIEEQKIVKRLVKSQQKPKVAVKKPVKKAKVAKAPKKKVAAPKPAAKRTGKK